MIWRLVLLSLLLALTAQASLPRTANTFGYAGDDERLWKQGPNGLQVWIGGIYEEKQGKVLFHVMAGGRKVCTFDATGTNVFEYYHADHLHSTSILTDTNGLRIQHDEYSAYGRVAIDSAACCNAVLPAVCSARCAERTLRHSENFRYDAMPGQESHG